MILTSTYTKLKYFSFTVNYLRRCKVKDQITDDEEIGNKELNCIDRSDESGCSTQTSKFGPELFKTCIVTEENYYDTNKDIIDHDTIFGGRVGQLTRVDYLGFQCGSEICLNWDIWCRGGVNFINILLAPFLYER